MNSDHPFIVSNEIVSFFKENFNFNDEQALEELIKELRKKGCSQMQTVLLLVDEGSLSFKDANKIVLNSKTWNG